MAGSGYTPVTGQESHPMYSPDPQFEALKSYARLQWMLNFEAVATVANDEDAITLRTGRKLES
jgi:hypothetical protein